MGRIFISYRRSESEYAAGSLGRELRTLFGDEQVFRDKEDIAGGVSWKQHVLDEIDHGSALLVLIGRNWASALDAHGQRRLDNSDDPIRLEIADALRDGAVVIPVLLENAEMPEAAELPEEIRELSDLNALRLRDGDWQHDIDKIHAVLEASGFRAADAASKSDVRRIVPWQGRSIVVLLLGTTGAIGYYVFARTETPLSPPPQSVTPARESTPADIHPTTPLPRLDYGVWTLKGAFEDSGRTPSTVPP